MQKKEPVIRTYQDLIHYKKEIKGYWVGVDGGVIPCYSDNLGTFSKTIAASEKVAKSMLAMAQISQLMPYYGGEVTNEEWANENIFKFSIIRIGNSISFLIQAKSIYSNYYYLAFHTDNMMREFLKNNEQLVKDYLMID